MKNFRLSPTAVALAIIGAVSVILNIVGLFLLPAKIQTSINLSGGSVELMNKYLYLAFSTVLIALCSGVGIYLGDKRIRYLIVDVILAAANAAVFIFNI